MIAHTLFCAVRHWAGRARYRGRPGMPAPTAVRARIRLWL